MERRNLIKSAAWSVPIIALAVATPLAAASTPPFTTRVCGGPSSIYGQNDNGQYTVTENALFIQYRNRPDIVDINIRFDDGSSQNIHKDASVVGTNNTYTVTWAGKRPVWVQVHSFNSHYGTADCPA